MSRIRRTSSCAPRTTECHKHGIRVFVVCVRKDIADQLPQGRLAAARDNRKATVSVL